MSSETPSREEVDQMKGAVVLEFGAPWCGICRRFAPEMERLTEEYPQVWHLKIEDGPGKPLGRSFRVKLWPTLVFLRDGEVIRQMARPSPEQAREGFEAVLPD